MADAKTMTILDPNGNVLSTVYLKDQWAREQIGTINASLTQLESDVEQLEVAQFTAPIDISSYTTTSNLYTCPCDGYAVANAGSQPNAKAIIRVYTPTANQYFAIGGWSNTTYTNIPLFVKKGTKLQAYQIENGGKAQFVPLNG